MYKYIYLNNKYYPIIRSNSNFVEIDIGSREFLLDVIPDKENILLIKNSSIKNNYYKSDVIKILRYRFKIKNNSIKLLINYEKIDEQEILVPKNIRNIINIKNYIVLSIIPLEKHNRLNNMAFQCVVNCKIECVNVYLNKNKKKSYGKIIFDYQDFKNKVNDWGLNLKYLFEKRDDINLKLGFYKKMTINSNIKEVIDITNTICYIKENILYFYSKKISFHQSLIKKYYL